MFAVCRLPALPDRVGPSCLLSCLLARLIGWCRIALLRSAWLSRCRSGRVWFPRPFEHSSLSLDRTLGSRLVPDRPVLISHDQVLVARLREPRTVLNAAVSGCDRTPSGFHSARADALLSQCVASFSSVGHRQSLSRSGGGSPTEALSSLSGPPAALPARPRLGSQPVAEAWRAASSPPNGGATSRITAAPARAAAPKTGQALARMLRFEESRASRARRCGSTLVAMQRKRSFARLCGNRRFHGPVDHGEDPRASPFPQ